MDKKRDTSKKKASILDAAVQAFKELGYDNASMDYISEIARASKRTVYNHFTSKELLFQEVLGRFMQETSELKNISYSSSVNLSDQLTKFSQAKLAIVNNPEWLSLMKITAGVFITHPQLALETMTKIRETEDTLISWLEAAHDHKRLNVPNPKLTANLFWSMVSGAFFWPAIFQGPMPDSEIKQIQTELITIFLARYQIG